MTYLEARPQMRTGDLIATAAPGLVSRGIRRVTRSEVSHVAGVICLRIRGELRLFIAEAHHGTGVSLVALSVWVRNQKGRVWWWPGSIANPVRRLDYKDEVLSHLGEPYEEDRWMLARVALGLKPPANSRWYCSELDLAGRAAAGVDLSGVSAGRWPEDCARLYGGVGAAVELA